MVITTPDSYLQDICPSLQDPWPKLGLLPYFLDLWKMMIRLSRVNPFDVFKALCLMYKISSHLMSQTIFIKRKKPCDLEWTTYMPQIWAKRCLHLLWHLICYNLGYFPALR